MTTPTTAAAQAGLAHSQRAAQDVQDKSRQIDSLKRDLNPSKDKSKKLREACEGFESVFIQKMWEQMRATVPKGGMLQGRDEQYWQGMFDQELSKKMSSAGGIGLADMMYDQLSRNLVSASRTTASGLSAAANSATDKGGFMVSAAPLLPPDSGNMSADAGNNDAGSPKGMDSSKAVASTSAAPSAPQGAGNAMYAGEAAQPEAVPHGAGKGSLSAAAPQSGNNPTVASTVAPHEEESPAVVQQVLEQLRSQNGQSSGSDMGAATGAATGMGMVGNPGSTMTGAQAVAAVQSMTPAQAMALAQGMPWAQVQAMNAPAGSAPAAQAGQNSAPSGLENAQMAAQIANTRMPAGGVLPPMTPMQRQGQIHYSASTKGKGTNTATTAKTMHESTQALKNPLQGNVQGAPGVSAGQFVQKSIIVPESQTPAGKNTQANMSMTAEQIAGLSAAEALAKEGAQKPVAAPANAAAIPGLTPTAGPGIASPAVPATAQEPQVINTTFTTNVPPGRRNSRQGQRMAKGQAIRSLNPQG